MIWQAQPKIHIMNKSLEFDNAQSLLIHEQDRLAQTQIPDAENK